MLRGLEAAASAGLWQDVADGGIAVSYTMGTLDRLSLGGQVTVSGRQQEKRLPVMAFGTVGIGGVDAVVSDSVARSLGMPARNDRGVALGQTVLKIGPDGRIGRVTARQVDRGRRVDPRRAVVVPRSPGPRARHRCTENPSPR